MREKVGLERRDALLEALVQLVDEVGGEITAEALDAVLTLAETAAIPAGPKDLSPFEVLRIRLNKAVARAVPPEIYRDRATRTRLRARVVTLLHAHGAVDGGMRFSTRRDSEGRGEGTSRR